jgi:hypothetical protein
MESDVVIFNSELDFKKQPEKVKALTKKLVVRPDRDTDQSFIF